MAETTVPVHRGRSGDESAGSSRGRWKLQGVEGSRAVTSKEGGPGAKVLHRDASRVKFNGNMIVRSKLSNRKKVFNNSRSNENVVEAKGTRDGRVTSANYRKSGTVANNNGGGKNRRG